MPLTITDTYVNKGIGPQQHTETYNVLYSCLILPGNSGAGIGF